MTKPIPTNKLLAALSRADFALLEPHLEPVTLPLRRQLERRNQQVDQVYFIDTGLASIVTSSGSNHAVEVGIVGNEGMTGVSVILAAGTASCECFVQTAGTARRIRADKLASAIAQSATLHSSLLRYVQTLMTQMAYTALANARYTLEERLARWLLMADDRAVGEAVHLTHEFLSVMLGTRRAGVTVALNEFRKRELVETRRGSIVILNRQGLEELANGSYGAPEAEYRTLFSQGS